jgi:hypothetical protein
MTMAESPAPTPEEPPFGEMEDRVYDAYQDQRNRLLGAEQDLGKSFDQYLLTLSGGALGLSLTFLDDIVTPGNLQLGWLLAIAWILLVVTVFGVGAMMRFSQVGHEKFRDILDEECAKGAEEFWKRVRDGQAKRREPTYVGWLNWVCLTTFSIGVGSLLVFALWNVSTKP